jgi:hypothetical protein
VHGDVEFCNDFKLDAFSWALVLVVTDFSSTRRFFGDSVGPKSPLSLGFLALARIISTISGCSKQSAGADIDQQKILDVKPELDNQGYRPPGARPARKPCTRSTKMPINITSA